MKNYNYVLNMISLLLAFVILFIILFGCRCYKMPAVKEKFEELFNTDEYECASGWGITEELNDIISRIGHLSITDPSGETLSKIREALDLNTKRLIIQGM